ncbi:hypothetical protein C0995_002206 [Termitomyces sp. Mi166|nr:hypothetical protein C0995_002206 [Termitomyces sp. Mi166\
MPATSSHGSTATVTRSKSPKFLSSPIQLSKSSFPQCTSPASSLDQLPSPAASSSDQLPLLVSSPDPLSSPVQPSRVRSESESVSELPSSQISVYENQLHAEEMREKKALARALCLDSEDEIRSFKRRRLDSDLDSALADPASGSDALRVKLDMSSGKAEGSSFTHQSVFKS